MAAERAKPHMPGANSVRALLQRGCGALAGAAASPQRDAALLMQLLCSQDRAWLLAHPDTQLTPAQIAEYDALLARRAAHEPMQYIRGTQEFFGLRLRVTPAVLIPRPETEHLVEAVLAHLPHDAPRRIADVGTGSGAIAIALAHALPQARIDALDISPAALDVARENAEAHGVAERIRFYQSDLFAAVQGERYDAVVSNPPYVAEDEALEEQVAAWEPHDALFAGAEGLDVYARLFPAAAIALAAGGLLAVEHGCGQRQALADMLQGSRNWCIPWGVQDLQGHDRILLATKLLSER